MKPTQQSRSRIVINDLFCNEMFRPVYPIRHRLVERSSVGVKTYGTQLMTFNGRSAARDFEEELLDSVMYAWQNLMEVKFNYGNQSLYRRFLPISRASWLYLSVLKTLKRLYKYHPELLDD